MLEFEVDHNAQWLICWRFAPPRQYVEDYLITCSASVERFAHGSLDSLQPIGGYGGQNSHKAAIGFVPAAQLAPQPGQRRRRQCQEFRVRGGIMGKKETLYGTTQSPCDSR